MLPYDYKDFFFNEEFITPQKYWRDENAGQFTDFKYNIQEFMNTPPPASESYISKDFIHYVKSVENSTKHGYRDGKWYPYQSREGGSPTVAYGHKLKSGEDFSQGITDADAERLLIKDLEDAQSIVEREHSQWVKKYLSELQSAAKQNPEHPKSKFVMGLDTSSPIFRLTPIQTQMLTDFVFNLGSLKKFPHFTAAVFKKDWNTAAKEYKRSYVDVHGQRHELGRNKVFFDTFLKHY